MLSASWACFKTHNKSFQGIKEYFLKLGKAHWYLYIIIKEADYVFLILHFGSFVATLEILHDQWLQWEYKLPLISPWLIQLPKGFGWEFNLMGL